MSRPALKLKRGRACSRCRTRKLRCDGQDPCGTCRIRTLKCEYAPVPPTAADPLLEALANLHSLQISDEPIPDSARRGRLRKTRSNISNASSGRSSSWLSGFSDAESDESSFGTSFTPQREWNVPSYDLPSHQLLLKNLDLTGKVTKLDRYPFESGSIADIYRGMLNHSESSVSARPMGFKADGTQQVAVKIFRRMHSDRETLEHTSKSLYEEAKIWRLLDHPNILPFLGISLDLGLSPALISPYCESGPIMKYLQSNTTDPKEKLQMTIGVANGLAYLHSHGIVHGSLCTKKVLVDADGSPVICGYGTSKTLGQPANSTSLVSTPIRFTSPERLSANDNSPQTAAGDVYAFSMVTLEILSGLQPYHHLASEHAVFIHVLRGERPIRAHLDPETITNRIWQLLTSLWNEHSYLTPEMSDITQDLIDIRDSEHDLGEDYRPSLPESTGPSSLDEIEKNSSSGEETWFGDSSLTDIHGHGLEGRVTQDDQYPFAGGGNSNIYRGKLARSDGRKIRVAIKMIRVSDDGSGHLDELLRRLRREIDVWKRLRHKNILPFIGVCSNIAPLPVLISPFYKFGHVGTFLKKHPTVDRNDLVCGVASGLQFLHETDVVHGDLKVHNVLVDKRGTPCICDFGISKLIDRRGFTTSSVGTAPYMAPELFFIVDADSWEETSPYTTKSSDVYSFGLLVLEILTAEPPKGRPSKPIVTAKLLATLQPKRSDYDVEKVSNEMWTVLDRCWAFDPQLRPTVTEVVSFLRFQSWASEGTSGSQSPDQMMSGEEVSSPSDSLRSEGIPAYASPFSLGQFAQRKRHITKEATDFLKTWLQLHSDHPYPSEEEKNQLCHATGLNMSQVSNWMINARRRILPLNEPLSPPVGQTSAPKGSLPSTREQSHVRYLYRRGNHNGDESSGNESGGESGPAGGY